jgi:hypothetical protein
MLTGVAGLSEADLDALVEQATSDANDEHEQLAGFHCMIEDYLDVPFRTTVLDPGALGSSFDPNGTALRLLAVEADGQWGRCGEDGRVGPDAFQVDSASGKKTILRRGRR